MINLEDKIINYLIENDMIVDRLKHHRLNPGIGDCVEIHTKAGNTISGLEIFLRTTNDNHWISYILTKDKQIVEIERYNVDYILVIGRDDKFREFITDVYLEKETERLEKEDEQNKEKTKYVG